MMEKERKKGDKGARGEKEEDRQRRTISKDSLFGDEDGSTNDARDEEGVAEEGSEVPRDRESAFG